MSRSLSLIVAFVFLAMAAMGQVLPGRYIVELDAEPAVTGARAKGDAAAARKAGAVLDQQAAVSAEAAAVGANVVGSTQAVSNTLIIDATDAEAGRLASLPGIKRVVKDRRVRLHLDGMVEVHQMPGVWAEIGFDKAGKGVKITVLDSGIDVSHPGLQDETLTPPEGFPKSDSEANQAFTNSKVIVARNYARGTSARDAAGHGTSVAMVAAGRTHVSDRGRITGFAPFAFLGNYRVTNADGEGSSSSILRAIDDAVKDGMDVINLSLGIFPGETVVDDIEAETIERASRAGVIVVTSAGNEGSGWSTIGNPAGVTSAITVGSVLNGRTYSGSTVYGGAQYLSQAGSTSQQLRSLSGALVDVSTVDSSALACTPLPAGSLAGKVVLISRGECFFSDKLQNAQNAGAIGAVVHTLQASPETITMDTGTVTLPAVMITYSDAVAIKRRLQETGGAESVTLNFIAGPVWSGKTGVSEFSSRGPSVDGFIKPDLLAVGSNVLTAAFGGTTEQPRYTVTQGTSFSSPAVAGAAAVLKAARPGLTTDQYRSLLINSAIPYRLSDSGGEATVQQAGAGLLYLPTAISATLAAAPVSLTFGVGTGTSEVMKTLSITNLASAADTVSIMVSPSTGSAAPSLSAATLQISAGATRDISVRLPPVSRGTGVHEGIITIRSSLNGTEARVPYWLGIPDTQVRAISWYEFEDATANSDHDVLFRATDSNGLSVRGLTPEVTSETAGTTVGDVRAVRNFPGYYSTTVKLGPGRRHDLLIKAGGLQERVSILVP